jgi:hypothetical protein
VSLPLLRDEVATMTTTLRPDGLFRRAVISETDRGPVGSERPLPAAGGVKLMLGLVAVNLLAAAMLVLKLQALRIG